MKKQLLFILMMMVYLTSCRTEGNLMISPTKKPNRSNESLKESYLLLSNGSKITIDPKIITNKTMAAKTINVGNTMVKTDDIMSIVVPKTWSTRIPKKEGKFDQNKFANMILKGNNINIYASVNTRSEMNYVSGSGSSFGGGSYGGGHWEHSTKRSVFYYMQNGDEAPLQDFNYINLRKAIPENNAASMLLDKYAKGKRVARTVHICGGGAMLAGIAVLASGGTGGGALLFGGLFTYTIGGVMKSNNIKNNMHKAFYLYNKGSRAKR